MLEIMQAGSNNDLNFPFPILKRDGRLQNFDSNKIYHSITLAVKEVKKTLDSSDYNDISMISNNIVRTIQTTYDREVSVDEVRTIVQQELVDHDYGKVAHVYLEFKTRKDEKRDREIDLNYTITKLLKKDSTVVNENANKDSNVFNTHRDLTAGTVAKTIGLKMLPNKVANAHLKGDIHWHDLDYTPYAPMTNCCLIDFKEMLNHGFKIGNAEVEPPHSIQVATAQMAQIIANVASSQYGGCSADRADEILAPFAMKNYKKHEAEAKRWIEDPNKQEIYAKERTRKDIYDSMQSLEYEINTLYSSNGQTPFTTLGFGLGSSWAEREIQKAILKVRIDGLGTEHRTAIFPKLVFTLKKGLNLNPNDPNYDIKQLAIECATKRMYPDVVSYDMIKKITGSFKAPMGCRSFLQSWKDKNGHEVSSGRMNLGVVTLNLPRIAIESKGDKKKFWQILKERVEVCHEALIYKVERTKEATPQNAPILFQYGAFGKRLKKDGKVDDLFKQGRATVSLGYIGLYEVGTVFYGPSWESNPQAKEFTIDVVKYLHDQCLVWENQTGYHFSVYATPAESLTDTFCRLDRAKFGNIPDITDKEYYTNSFHYDIRKNPNPFEKLKFESDYPYYSSGGFIHYCEYPNLKQNPRALEAVWDYAYDLVGYLGTNTPIDQCFKCGFKGEFKATERGFMCPSCSNTDPATVDVVKRTCGYLGNPNQRPMVHGRHEEIKHRVKHLSLGNDQLIGTDS